MIRFLLANTERCINGLDPTISVLAYLRDAEQLKGTKNGCSTGDGGACTVVLGEPVGDTLRYRAINACITPMVSLHGKQLITVEHLKHTSGLHAVQRAMVDCHASQCGYCTPGIVMSLFAHLHTHEQPVEATLIESLSGNLCRCTGYRPILQAGAAMYADRVDDQFTEAQASTVVRLKHISAAPVETGVEKNGRRYYWPQSIRQLTSILQQYPDATLLAGGTDLMQNLLKNMVETDTVVYTGYVRELHEVNATATALEIGAAVAYSDCAKLLVEEYPELDELLQRFGSQQIRNVATLAGNIGSASPCGDMLPFLIAVGAEVALRLGEDIRSSAVEKFIALKRKSALLPGEFIEQILVPRRRPDYVLRVYKVSKRREDDISSICGAFNMKIEDGLVCGIRIAFGGMAEVTKRAEHCEAALQGQPWNQLTVGSAMEALEYDFTPISDLRASAGYRMQVAKNMLQRLFLQTDDPSSGPKVEPREN